MSDHVLIATSKDGALRARVAWLPSVLVEACRRHPGTAQVHRAFGRALGIAAVFPVDWKDTQRVSLQFTGEGPLGALFVDHREGGGLRVMRKGEAAVDALKGSVDLGFLPNAKLTVMEQAPNGAYNQGQVDIATGALDLDLERWFEQSQQTPTLLRARALFDAKGTPTGCTSLLVQTLGGHSSEALISATDLDNADFSASPEALLQLAFGARAFDVLEERPLAFRCSCSREKVAASIALFDEQELLEMIQEDEGAQTHCEFCGQDYIFDAKDLCSIYDAKRMASGEKVTQ